MVNYLLDFFASPRLFNQEKDPRIYEKLLNQLYNCPRFKFLPKEPADLTNPLRVVIPKELLNKGEIVYNGEYLLLAIREDKL